MELLVVGAGAIGRWLGATVDAELAFTDVDPEAARTAADDAGGEAVPIDGDERFDAVAVAVPMPVAADAIETHAPRARDAMLDLTGSMVEPVNLMAEHAGDRERLSLHPLFAPVNAPGHIAMVPAAPGPVAGRIHDDLEAAGNDLFETSAEAHDQAMETVQAKTHAAVLAFALAADEVDPAFATPVFEQLTELVEEVTDGHSRVYADIQEVFNGAEAVAEAAELVAEADRERFEQLFRDAGE
ncbi:MAG: prephenate dehydrogenase [Halobacteriales archaeon]